MSYLFTSESVGQGHPDKICDQISDAIVDQFLAYDNKSRVACETMVTTGQVVIAGEVSSNEYVDIQKVARETINKIGYTKSDYQFCGDSCGILNAIHDQSSDIAQGVDNDNEDDQGAGDIGLMFGLATNETDAYMPLTAYLSHMIVKALDDIRHEGKVMTYLRPDSKAQVTVEYDSDTDKPIRINNIVVCVQHDDIFESSEDMQSKIRADIKKYVIPRIIEQIERGNIKKIVESEYPIYVNTTGKFVIGGPHGDTGLTGRKIIVDTYGGRGAHGGGAFCVDSETEYLTKNGWKKISEYNGEDIAQWDDGKIEFVTPHYYHKHPAEKMYRIYNDSSLDMVLSEHHDMVIRTSKGNIVKKMVRDVIDIEKGTLKNGNNGTIPCYYTYDGESGINMTDDEIRLQIAFCADGTILKDNVRGRIRVKKSYKKERLYELLDGCGIEYKVANDDDYLMFYYKPTICSKSLRYCFAKANKHQLEVIAKELPMWDGDRKKVFRTTKKDDADFAQYVFMSVYGKDVSILTSDRIGRKQILNGKEYELKSLLYIVTVLKHTDATFRKGDKKGLLTEEYNAKDGMMYCFTVPSSMLLLRRNNMVFVTGNCGKDSTKVDRSGAYAARYIAKNMVAAGISDEVLIQVSYAIGKSEPMSLYVNTYGKSKLGISDGEIAERIKNIFDFKPKTIEKKLKLRQPMFFETATYGHFGRKNEIVEKKFTDCHNNTKTMQVELFTWEKLDMVDELKKEFGLN